MSRAEPLASCPLAIATPRGQADYITGTLATGTPRYTLHDAVYTLDDLRSLRDPYADFLAAKHPPSLLNGFPLAPTALHPTLFPFQQQAVRWALARGTAALFAERGLGKTFMQVEYGRHVADYTRGKVLIACPLAVAGQTMREAAKLGVGMTYVRSQAEADAAPTSLVISNYDMVLRQVFDPKAFSGIILDESSILKHFTSATRQYLTTAFAKTPFRLACTATPSPNDIVELGQHSEFLGVKNAGDVLTEFFIRDSNRANTFRLRGLSVRAFWDWVITWGCCIGKPSDLDPSYDDRGYDLPPLTLHEHCVDVDYQRAWTPDKTGQLRLVHSGAASATEMWREKRATLGDRAARVADLVRTLPADEQLLIWHLTNSERDAIQRAIPEVITVSGEQPLNLKEQRLSDFAEGRSRVLSIKPEIGAWGLNFQRCHRMIYASIDHKFELFYQSLGRCHRFGQARPVDAHIVYAESEASVLASLYAKWEQHNHMHAAMLDAMRAQRQHLTRTRAELQPVRTPTWLRKETTI